MDDRLEKIRMRADAAWPGPWKSYDAYEAMPNVINTSRIGNGDVNIIDCPHGYDIRISIPDVEFICNAREDVAWMLEKLYKYQKALQTIYVGTSPEDPCFQIALEALKENATE